MPLPLIPLLAGAAGRMAGGAAARGLGASAGQQTAAKMGGQATAQFGARALHQSSQQPTHQDPVQQQTVLQQGAGFAAQHPGKVATAATVGAIRMGNTPAVAAGHTQQTNALLQSTQFR